MERNRAADLEKLADLYFQHLQRNEVEYGGWGIDDKRPFGFSGSDTIAADILTAIGWEAAGGSIYSDEQVEYAHGLYDELGAYIKKEWAQRKKSVVVEVSQDGKEWMRLELPTMISLVTGPYQYLRVREDS